MKSGFGFLNSEFTLWTDFLEVKSIFEFRRFDYKIRNPENFFNQTQP